ncbi:serine hydrolase domain-containing protein [Nocardia neocaledoniensis]|uniref:serine hydrolase domain-containing protein n=1 Tax=Nocardia neocaledoniensis TaxID=236511 RepID=UPI0024546728|nr:serine hydrolase [Nocardia neocaledoniensis]
MTEYAAELAGMGLFTGIAQHENFCRMHTVVPSARMTASSEPQQWPVGDPMELPASYEFAGRSKSFEDFFVETDTAALLVLQGGVIRHEQYALTGGPDVPWISMSVAKSVVSALVGIAVAEGHIRSIDAPISDYVPVAPGSAYDGVSIKDVLQMSSGARWNEDYSDVDSDVFRLNAAMAGLGTLDEFVATVVRDNEPGAVCRYNSGDTQVLGALLVRATKRSITEYTQEKLFEPLGMTSPGYWLLDSTGMEVAFAGLNMTARDFAKFGELYRNSGRWQGNQIVPEDWVRASVTPDARHLQPGRPIVGTHRFDDYGYGYQWWVPAGDRGEFSAIGVYNQFVYVDPTADAVIVKLSANRAYGTSDGESTNREAETLAFLRSITSMLRS